MTTQLENELRNALTHKASEVPVSRAMRLSSADYKPRTHSAHRRVAFGTAGVVAVALVATIVTGSVGPGKQSDSAAWSATPTTPAPGQVSAAQAACLRSLTIVNRPGPGFTIPIQNWRRVFTITRGAFTLVGYKATDRPPGDVDLTACLTDGSPLIVSNMDLAGYSPPNNLAPNTIEAAQDGPSGDYTVTIGEAGSQVTGVTFVMEQGKRTITIPATVAHGVYALWWPVNMLVKSVHVTTAHGTTDGPLPVVSPPLPPR